jgi:hypothetical protein
MMDQPSAAALIEAVRAFLEKNAMPELSGRTQFHARVAANALAIVARELAQGPQACAGAQDRLRRLTGQSGDLMALNRALCAQIRDGHIALDDPALVEHLWAVTRAKIAIDQPGYASISP